jgi:hypothetical protein
MFGALIRAAERWRVVKVTEFERRQITAVRKELDRQYEDTVGLNPKPSNDEAQVRISSKLADLTDAINTRRVQRSIRAVVLRRPIGANPPLVHARASSSLLKKLATAEGR